jgi:hypothetical protein
VDEVIIPWSSIVNGTVEARTLSDKEQEISRLKDVGRKSNDENTVRSAFDRLTVYGKEGIKPITDIIEDPTVHQSIKQCGLNAIKRIRIFTPFNP